MLGNSIDYIASQFTPGDESGNIKYGYRMIGTSDSPSPWTDGLPKPSDDSEFLDLGGILNIVGNLRKEETMLNLAEKLANVKGVSNLGKLEYGEYIEHFGASIESLMDAMGDKQSLSGLNNTNKFPQPNIRKFIPSGNSGNWQYWYPNQYAWSSKRYQDSTVSGKNGAPDTTFEKVDHQPSPPKTIIRRN